MSFHTVPSFDESPLIYPLIPMFVVSASLLNSFSIFEGVVFLYLPWSYIDLLENHAHDQQNLQDDYSVAEIFL